MTAVGLIINERSSRMRPMLGDILHVARQFPNVRPSILNGVDGLDRALAEMSRAGVDTIVMAGGDGTIQASFTDAINRRRFETAPDYVALPCGMTNVIAADCGLQGSPIDSLDRFLFRKNRGDVKRVKRALMGVRFGEKREPVYGFFLGAGAFYTAVKFSRMEIQTKGARRSLAMGLTIGGSIFNAIFGEKPTEPPLTASFESTNTPLPEDAQPLTLALMTTLKRLVIGVYPFWGAGAGELAVTTIGFPAQRMLAAAPSVMRGRGAPWLGEAGYQSWRTDKVGSSFEGTVVFDGELFDLEKGERMIVETTHDAGFLT